LQVEALHNEQANADFSVLCELLKDYVALIGAIKVPAVKWVKLRIAATVRPLAHTPAFCRIRLRSWSFSHTPALPLPVASTDHVYVVSLILNAAQVRRANSNAVH
jgi:hypothetical protein